MEILRTAADARSFVWQLRMQEMRVGLVPTMGALHRGHVSLVLESQRRCDHTVATIFVNPTQFAAGEDLDKYPRTLEADLTALREAGCAAAFVPEVSDMYPPECTTRVQPPDVALPLEGVHRPEHFQGVATVVLKLFHILPATHAFFGQKDLQQLRVIEAMVRDLNFDIDIVPCPIVREPDGLAMSSRNRYLNETQRQRALQLSIALAKAEQAIRSGQRDPAVVQQLMQQQLHCGDSETGVDSIDYAVAVGSQTLQPIDTLTGEVALLIAARVGATRLIDNRLVRPDATDATKKPI